MGAWGKKGSGKLSIVLLFWQSTDSGDYLEPLKIILRTCRLPEQQHYAMHVYQTLFSPPTHKRKKKRSGNAGLILLLRVHCHAHFLKVTRVKFKVLTSLAHRVWRARLLKLTTQHFLKSDPHHKIHRKIFPQTLLYSRNEVGKPTGRN